MNDPKCDHLIRWSPSGTSFLVLDEDEFSKTLIPDLFKHNNYASFVRQLNMYGFHKVVGLADGSLKTSEQRSKPPSEYKNDFFIRGMPDLMWLIQKPKNTTKRSKGRKKGKLEDSDEDVGSDREVMTSSGIIDDSGQIQPSGGGYIEAPPSSQVQSTISKNQVEQILQQLEQLRTHQQIMTSAINRLRKDHTQLYEQSIAFQTLHDRHETSISAILTFLATVYDKSLAGSLNSQTLQHLFQGAVDSSQNAGQVMGNPGSAMANMGRAGVVGAASGQQRTPFRRRQLMLPPASHANGSISGVLKDQSGNQTQPQKQQQQAPESPGPFNSYQSPSIQEVFSPVTGQLSSTPNSPQQSHSHLNPGFFSPSIFSLGRHDNNLNSQALTPRLLHRAITPLLQAAEQQRTFASQHNKQVVETHNGIEQINALQEQQNDGISKLMEIVGPYATSTSETTPIHPISSIPTSPASTIGAATVTPVAVVAVPPAAAVTTGGPSVPTVPAAAGSPPAASVEDVVNANIDTLPPRQTPSPSVTSNYVNAPPLSSVGIGVATSPGDTVGLGGGEPADFDVDIDQFLDTEWLPQDGFQTIEDPVADASQSLSEVSLDQTLFMDDPSYGQGFLQGGLHGMESMMGGGAIGASSAALDNIGQILGTNPSTTVGSPHSPAFSDGTGSLIDGGNIGGLEGDLIGSAKKKRRTG